MATVYRVEIISDWLNYTEEQLKELIKDRVDPRENNIRITQVKIKQ
tara:strand:- start:1352 stop:1489 length:138 start_codon:yes stop_codon:yes gene_type:complete